jgi:hypothetical protein
MKCVRGGSAPRMSLRERRCVSPPPLLSAGVDAMFNSTAYSTEGAIRLRRRVCVCGGRCGCVWRTT